MEQKSSSSEKKTDETNISTTLTDQIVFKGDILNQNSSSSANNKCKNISKKKHNKNSSSSLQSDDHGLLKHNHNDPNLSFRTKDGKNNQEVDEIEKLCSKVSDVLISHELDQNPKKEKEVVDYKKIFYTKNEKELEVFESERGMNNEPNILSSSESYDSDSEDYGFNNSHHKSKSLRKVICTLSKIENGSATFVSKDDLIFVLPSFFIPKNLNIGNTYMFKLNELDQANNKINKINTIHKYYSQDE